MAMQPQGAPALFKDYCLILQVHPEADAGMVEAAYWHLARRYNEAAPRDPSARAKLDELNEAYSVLGSPERHESYLRLRAQVLGEGTLPAPPPPPLEPLPLPVMRRQRQQPGTTTAADERDARLRLPRLPVLRLSVPRLRIDQRKHSNPPQPLRAPPVHLSRRTPPADEPPPRQNTA